MVTTSQKYVPAVLLARTTPQLFRMTVQHRALPLFFPKAFGSVVEKEDPFFYSHSRTAELGFTQGLP